MTNKTHRIEEPALVYGLINRVVVFAMLVLLTFFLPRLMPGDPLDMVLASDLARELSAAEIQDLRQQMGMDGSLLEQFIHYCAAVAQGDFGYSVHHAASVTDLLGSSLPWTALLILCAMPLFLLVGVGVGIEAGRFPHHRLDRIMTTLITLLASIPPFATAVLLLAVFGFF